MWTTLTLSILGAVAIAKAMSVNTVASTPPNIFPDTPETQSKPANIAANTAVVPRSLPSILGAIMVFSASSIYSLENKGNSFSVIGRQLFFLFISIPLCYLASRQKLDRWKNLARFGFVISAIVLIIVAIPGVGKSINGNQNWISLGFVDIQPSEIVKVLMILWAAHMLAIREHAGRHTTNVLALITPGFVLIMALIMLGRDNQEE